MIAFEFEWDNDKADSNLLKHKVSFDEAKTVFFDPFAIIFEDMKHSSFEMREIIIGSSFLFRMLIVSFTYRNDKIRIISSRLANKKEKEQYEKNQTSN